MNITNENSAFFFVFFAVILAAIFYTLIKITLKVFGKDDEKIKSLPKRIALFLTIPPLGFVGVTSYFIVWSSFCVSVFNEPPQFTTAQESLELMIIIPIIALAGAGLAILFAYLGKDKNDGEPISQ